MILQHRSIMYWSLSFWACDAAVCFGSSLKEVSSPESLRSRQSCRVFLRGFAVLTASSIFLLPSRVLRLKKSPWCTPLPSPCFSVVNSFVLRPKTPKSSSTFLSLSHASGLLIIYLLIPKTFCPARLLYKWNVQSLVVDIFYVSVKQEQYCWGTIVVF